MRSPRITSVRTRIAAALGAGLITASTAAFVLQARGDDDSRDAQADRPHTTKTFQNDRNWKALAAARAETARAIVDQDMLRFQNRVDPEQVTELPVWSRQLMLDRIRLAKTRAERVAAIREHRDLTQRVEKIADGYAKIGQCRPADALKARYYRLEAEQNLVEEGVDIGEVELPRLPKPAAAAPGP